MKLSSTEENYLKSIFALTSVENHTVSTNALAERLQNSAASVTDMVKKLANKNLVEHIPYRGVKLKTAGKKTAIFLLRKHRLWECFLHDNLGFSWDELHEIAEELEHIQSPSLIDRLDAYLGFPKFDPHGDPIPDSAGNTAELETISLAHAPIHKNLVVKNVMDDPEFLKYLTELEIGIGSKLTIDKKVNFDKSLLIITENNHKINFSTKAAEWIFVQIR